MADATGEISLAGLVAEHQAAVSGLPVERGVKEQPTKPTKKPLKMYFDYKPRKPRGPRKSKAPPSPGAEYPQASPS